jgi:CheY-like chemotaxis protein
MPHHILIADDDPELLLILQQLLILEGYAITTASNGRDAVVESARGRPDVVLMDLNMPLLDGVDAAIRIKETQLDSPPRIVMYTANPESAIRTRFTGYDAYLQKPADFDLVLAAVGAGPPGP